MNPNEVRLVRGLLPFLFLAYGESEWFHGYGIIQELRKKYGIYLGPSTIYPLLHSMEEDGLLKSEWKIGRNRRPVKVYRRTEEGVEVLQMLSVTIERLIESIPKFGELKEPKNLER